MPEQFLTKERADLACDCYAANDPLWGPACTGFLPVVDKDGVDWCEICGHKGECHE